MKIQYASDLHIEFPENKEFLKINPLKPIGDILVLAGDIVPFAVLDKHLDFFNYISDNFENTYWIPGNHEYYYSNMVDRSGAFHEKINENVHRLNNNTIKCNGVDLIFTTLWSEIKPANQWKIHASMNDFRVIKHGDDILSIEQYNSLYKESVSFLNRALDSRTSEKSIVISHHVPTFMNYPEAYKGNALNEAFAVELFDFIEKHQPDYWIYGHTHCNTTDFTIEKTSLVTNQLGYVQNNEHISFNNCKIIEL
jgi:predicted phosphohydrolase